MIKQGKVKVLGVAARKRTPLLPDVPTVEEAGLPGYDLRVWYGYFAPARTPKPIVQQLHHELHTALQVPEIQSRFALMGTEPIGMGPEEFSKTFQADLRKWAQFIKSTGLKLD
jgi:tripartite-type tricarboxylate transporter receptor subunit TctC